MAVSLRMKAAVAKKDTKFVIEGHIFIPKKVGDELYLYQYKCVEETGMRHVITAEQSRLADKETIAQGTSSLTLMENAGVEAYNRIRKEIGKRNRILVLCGTGGNGGDGYVIARCLHDSGYKKVAVLPVGKPESADCKTNAEAYTGKIVDKIDCYYDVFIDCIYGTGREKNVCGKARKIIEQVNDLGGKKVSIDVPSGIDATTGEVKGVAFRCDLLLVIQFMKTGLFLNDAPSYFKKARILDIAIEISDKRYLPKYVSGVELDTVRPADVSYQVIDAEWMARFHGVSEKTLFVNFARYLRHTACMFRTRLVYRAPNPWISDGKQVLILEKDSDVAIREGFAFLSK